jgi:S-formylglutathione hydrolase FrmB
MRAAAALVVLVLALASVGDGINRHFRYIPSWEALFGQVSPDLQAQGVRATTTSPAGPLVADHGVVEHITIPGLVSGVSPGNAYVYLPAGYFDPAMAQVRYPVLYLLHGSPGVAIDWIRGGWADRTMDALVRDGVVRPFIIVFPDFNRGYLHDTECENVVGGPQMQTYLVVDVVRWVDSHYRTVRDRRARAIGGLSTGAYCGINLTLRHQDVFSAIVSHSGYARPDISRYSGPLFGGDRRLQLANSPAWYLPKIGIREPLGAYFDAGTHDRQSLVDTLWMARVMRRRGIAVYLRTTLGGRHDFLEWRDGLRWSLPWVSRWFVRMGVAVPANPPRKAPAVVALAPDPRTARA